jgi:hypothetical protein
MASRLLKKIMSLMHGHVVVAGSFAPNGSSALSAASTYGVGFTAAYTSTGLYTITFADLYPKLVSFTCSLQEHTAGDQILIIGDYSATAGTITITNWDISGGAATDIAASTYNRINFVAHFSNTSFQ